MRKWTKAALKRTFSYRSSSYLFNLWTDWMIRIIIDLIDWLIDWVSVDDGLEMRPVNQHPLSNGGKYMGDFSCIKHDRIKNKLLSTVTMNVTVAWTRTVHKSIILLIPVLLARYMFISNLAAWHLVEVGEVYICKSLWVGTCSNEPE